jgi:hypothetical protein
MVSEDVRLLFAMNMAAGTGCGNRYGARLKRR